MFRKILQENPLRFASQQRAHHGLARSINLVVLFFAALIVSPPGRVDAGLITVSNLGTSDIIVPVFDQRLGTLESVDLTVTLRAGEVSMGGGHSHEVYTITSSNVLSGPDPSGAEFSSFQLPPTNSSPSHQHAVNTPSYSGGGIDVGGFNFQTSSSGFHNHSGTVSWDSFQQFGLGWRSRASIQMSFDPGHTHSYGEQTKALSFSGGSLVPFLGAEDIVIAGGPVEVSSAGSHVHSVRGFSVTANDFRWFFPRSETPFVGGHNHILTPTFDTVATFRFTEGAGTGQVAAVPEPSSLALFGIAASLGGFSAFRRRRQENRQVGMA
jgi:hypothetical protein